MARGRHIPKRVTAPDPKYNSELVAKFINFIMQAGKKTVAQRIVYNAFNIVEEKRKDNALKLFQQALEIAKPQVEVRSRRVGGANYQVPMPVSNERQHALAFRWITGAAKARKGKAMDDRLAGEIMDILDGVGGALKKKEDMHRMADANKAFAHFARFSR